MENIDWGFVQTLLIVIGVPSLSSLVLFLWRQYNVRKARINRIKISYVIGVCRGDFNEGILFNLVNNSNYTLRNLKSSIKILKRRGDNSVSGLGLWEDYQYHEHDEYTAPLAPDQHVSFLVEYLQLTRFLGGAEDLFGQTHRSILVRKNWLRFEEQRRLTVLFWPKPVTLLIELNYYIDDKGFSVEKHVFSLKCMFPETLERHDLSAAELADCGELVPLKTPIWVKQGD